MSENYKLLPFNFKTFEDKYLVIDHAGGYCFLEEQDFYNLIKKQGCNDLLKDKLAYQDEVGLTRAIERYKSSKSYLNEGTSLFIVVLTNRCNQDCIYCQASKKNSADRRYDMSEQTAKKAVDLIMQSPQRHITIEFQGGEPLLNFKTLKFIVEYADEMTRKLHKKITFNLVSNLLILNKDYLKFIFDHKVSICTSLDGNKEVHDYNRPCLKGGSFDYLVEKIQLIREEGRKNKKRVRINAIQTTTRKSLDFPKEIIDEYLKLGFRSIYIRPLNRFGLARKAYDAISYSPYDYLKFYKKVLDYIIQLNQGGNIFIEGTARIFLEKIFQKIKTNYMDSRSPCGAVIGQMAINYDGNVYTCDEGRMMAEGGDDSFKIGNVYTSLYKDLYDSPITKIVCMASCIEGMPRCYQCPYLPYCGVCPIVNYMEDNDIFKNNGYRCIINEGILDLLFEYLKNDKKAVSIFSSWIRQP